MIEIPETFVLNLEEMRFIFHQTNFERAHCNEMIPMLPFLNLYEYNAADMSLNLIEILAF